MAITVKKNVALRCSSVWGTLAPIIFVKWKYIIVLLINHTLVYLVWGMYCNIKQNMDLVFTSLAKIFNMIYTFRKTEIWKKGKI